MYLHARMFCTLGHTSSIPKGTMYLYKQEHFLAFFCNHQKKWVDRTSASSCTSSYLHLWYGWDFLFFLLFSPWCLLYWGQQLRLNLELLSGVAYIHPPIAGGPAAALVASSCWPHNTTTNPTGLALVIQSALPAAILIWCRRLFHPLISPTLQSRGGGSHATPIYPNINHWHYRCSVVDWAHWVSGDNLSMHDNSDCIRCIWQIALGVFS